jgi:peptide chain release factor
MNKEIWVQISSGRGPDECCRAAFHITRLFSQEAEAQKLKVVLLEQVAGNYPETLRSALLSLYGADAAVFLQNWLGTVQWTAQSPFRPQHKRRNWFISISKLEPPDETTFSSNELKFEVMRASGPGGQHVNKVSAAVRVTHLPSGMSAMAQAERSQQQNRKLALTRLLLKLEQRRTEQTQQWQQEQWGRHDALERGNPVRCFFGPQFQEKIS